jgi:signal transduction histidine kinase
VPEDEIEQLREALIRSDSRLRKSKADLQEFVSMVSHDLREPLRTVGMYCELLSSRMPATPDTGANQGESANGDEADLFRRYILDAVDRAQTLLTGMVEYADAEPEKRRPMPVEMEAVYWEAERRLDPAPGSEPPALSHDPLPTVSGDFDTLTKLLRHLLDNAVKFNPKAKRCAHVSAKQTGGEWLFSVRDNGPGIEAAHRERIFGLFKRLHGRDVRGSGLGLAYAQRAVEWHGGRIWVESTPGEGSTFYFTLPAVD